MTVLDSFVAFARALPPARREEMEMALAELMDSYDSRFELTGEELAELKHRAAEQNPEFSDPEDIAEIFGKPFAA